jgi:hypothetical protein
VKASSLALGSINRGQRAAGPAAPRPHATPTSALRRLRESVRAAAPGGEGPAGRPFLANFRPLLPGDEDRFRSLGAPLDLRGPGIHGH